VYTVKLLIKLTLREILLILKNRLKSFAKDFKINHKYAKVQEELKMQKNIKMKKVFLVKALKMNQI